jgi:hypothetical protein
MSAISPGWLHEFSTTVTTELRDIDMDEDERQDADNTYVTLTAAEFYRVFGVRAPYGEWEASVHWFRAEFGVNPETLEEYDPMTVLTALRDLRQVETVAAAIALTPPLPEPEQHA